MTRPIPAEVTPAEEAVMMSQGVASVGIETQAIKRHLADFEVDPNDQQALIELQDYAALLKRVGEEIEDQIERMRYNGHISQETMEAIEPQ